MNEHGFFEGSVMMSRRHLPDFIVWDLDHSCTIAFDGSKFCFWSVVWNNYRARNPSLARLPCKGLGHVSSATSVDPSLFCFWTGKCDGVACTSNFEGARRLEILQFQ